MNGQSRNTLLIVVLVVIAAFILLPLLGMPMMWGMMGGGFGMMGGNAWWGWVIMLLFWVLLIGGIALVVFWLVRQGYIGGSTTSGAGASRERRLDNSGRAGQAALDILNERYARGEINREQYDQMKRDILGD
jgi:putative membrane protein